MELLEVCTETTEEQYQMTMFEEAIQHYSNSSL